jgi:acetyl-CoA acetyltransferase
MEGPLMGAPTSSITGIGESAVGKVEGSTALSLMQRASIAAIEDAGLGDGEVDGVFTGRSMVAPLHRVAVILSERLGLRPSVFGTFEAGGATSVRLLNHAAMAIAAGKAQHNLCVTGDNLATGLTKENAIQAMAENAHPEFEVPFGTFPPAAYALVANAHMHRFGTTREQLSRVPVETRKWAALNDSAQKQTPITADDVSNAKAIASPFTAEDCALVSDGAGAFIVSRRETVADLPKPGVDILGYGEAAGHEYISQAKDLTSFASVDSGRGAFAQARLNPKDIDVVELYDCFSITPLVLLEDLGFCAKGEGGPFLAENTTGPGGSLPMNTHGGLLAHAHPGKPGGIFHITEAVRQLRKHSGARQVANAEHALVHGVGGMFSAHATAILGVHHG